MGFFSKLTASELFKRSADASEPKLQRWIVVDVETTGLDPSSDHLLAIAAVGMRVDSETGVLTLLPSDSMEVTLKHESPAIDRDNILIHGIGVARQRAGMEPREALAQFVQWVGNDRLLAFHAGFDRALLGRHAAQHLGAAAGRALQASSRWVCIEQLSAATHPKSQSHSLDEWLDELGLHCAQRHQAAADALIEAQVLQRIWPSIRAQATNWREVQKLAAAARWLRA
jgi:DNA polymerase III subunit epsilon